MERRVTIAPFSVTVMDPVWHPILGMRLELPGGTELVPAMRATDTEQIDADDASEAHVVYIINDPYFPSVFVAIERICLEASTQAVPDSAHGPRVGRGRMRCTAGVHRRRPGAASDSCLPCYYQRWTARAREAGMIIEAEKS